MYRTESSFPIPEEVEEFGAKCSEHQVQYKREIPVKPGVPCVIQVRIPIAKAPTQKNAVSKEGGRRLLSNERRATSSDNKRKAKRSVRIQKAFLHQGRDHSHEDHVADRGFFIRDIVIIWYTPVPSSKVRQFLQQKLHWTTMERKYEPTSVGNVKSRSKQHVSDKARANNRKVHFARLVDLHHLKHAYLAGRHNLTGCWSEDGRGYLR